jgi:DNA repair protein RadC
MNIFQGLTRSEMGQVREVLNNMVETQARMQAQYDRLTERSHHRATVREPVPTPVRSVEPSASAKAYLQAEARWLQGQPIEHFVSFALNESGDICGVARLPGGDHHVDIDVAHIVKEAKSAGAVSTIMLHNHPTQACSEASSADEDATTKMREALAGAGISLLDHLIVSKAGHGYSFRESAMEPETDWSRRCRKAASLPFWLKERREMAR